MPQAIGWVIGAVTNAVLAFEGIATGLLLAIGVPAGIAKATAAALLPGLLLAGGAFLSVPQIPHPEVGKRAFKQTIPPRRRGYGTNVRISGYYACYEATKGKAYLVIAYHHGRIEGINAYYLHDDLVTLTGGFVDTLAADRYGLNKVKIEHRLGESTETAYSDIVSGISTLWTSAHRGDRVASLGITVQSVEDTRQQKVFPNGLPEASVAAALSPTWDWRVTGQDPDGDTTWAANDNPFLSLANFITGPADDGCMGEDFDRRIAPSLAYWTAAADDCDSSIAKIGGTEPKYEMGGFYDFDNHPADIVPEMLRCCDGWMSEAGDGSLIVRSGVYYTPVIGFGDRHVIDYSFSRFRPDEEVVNELMVSYCDPGQQHNMVECDPWRHEADITARGIERSDNFELRWVQRHTQARRLAKARMAREQAPTRGTFTTNLYGLRALGERFVDLSITEMPALTGIVAEVLRVNISLTNKTLTYTFVQADPNMYAWDPATEEGNAPDGTPSTPDDDAAPVVTDVRVFFEFTGGDYSARIQLYLDDPDQEGLRYVIRRKVSTGNNWTVEASQDGSVELITPFRTYVTSGLVPSDRTIDIEAAYVFPDGTFSDWSITESVSTATDGSAPGGVTPGDDLGGGGPGDTEVP